MGGAGTGGVTVLVTGQNSPGLLRLDGTHVYWMTYASNARAIRSFPLAGGPVTTVVQDPGLVYGLAIDDTRLYFATNQVPSVLAWVPLTGGTPTPLITGTSRFVDVVLDATSAFVAAGTSIDRVPLPGGGSATPLAMGARADRVAVNATHVYWTSRTAGTVNRATLAGGAPELLASGLQEPLAIALDDRSVYWGNLGGGTIMKLDLGPGQPTTLAAVTSGPTDLRLDGTHVYFATGLGGEVLRVAIGGGPVELLASDATNPAVGSPQDLAVDATHVYWGNKASNGTIVRLAKP
jgi:sugar lactone lactonase YvrE